MNPRQNSWTAPAERSGDGAFICNRALQSGVALRLPPQSKFTAGMVRRNGLETAPVRITNPLFKLT